MSGEGGSRPASGSTAGTGTGPGRRGYRWPAEWEPHRATWIAWPHNKETWPGGLDLVEDAYCEMVRAIVPGEAVEVLVEDPDMAERVRAKLAGASSEPVLAGAIEGIGFHVVATNDAWIRDSGGIFLRGRDGSKERLLLDFQYDAWGGKYPPWDLDAEVAKTMAKIASVASVESPYVLEAGGIDGDGEGTILTTESCLLNPNRLRPGQSRSRDEMEELLADTLGAERVLWLGEGIEGDDTDGHVDDLTRFVAPGRVVTVVGSDPADVDFGPLAENRRRLETLRDSRDRPLEVIELPMPGRIEAAHGRLPASYANFYVANEAVLVPVFGVDADREALAILEDCFADRGVVPIPSRALVEGLGAVHCLTQQEPRA